jgi:hypothetical protein
MCRKYILNVAFINSFFSSYGNYNSQFKQIVAKHVIEVHREQFELLEKDVPMLLRQGSKIIPKLCNATSFTTELYTQNYLKLVLGVLYYYVEASHWYKDIVYKREQGDVDSLIFFELFDAEENLLYSPMDLLNPITIDYESRSHWFCRRNNYTGVTRCEFTDDKNQKFVLAKSQTDFRTAIDMIATSVDIYRLRVNPNANYHYDDFDYLSLQSIYSEYTEDSTYVLGETIPCETEKSFLFLSHINNELLL